MDNATVNQETNNFKFNIKKLFAFKIEVMPLGVFLVVLLIDFLLISKNMLPKDMLGAISIMVLYGAACEEIGKRLPIIKILGGNVIMPVFLTSYLVYIHFIPKQAVDSVSNFMKQTNFLSAVIACIIVGSIISMNRKVMIKAFIRIFIPMIAALIAGSLVGVGIGLLFGLSPYKTYFFIVAPVMVGGIGEGALPLSMGYAAILKQSQGELLAQILPCVLLGDLVAIVFAGMLKVIGEKYPKYSGKGALIKAGGDDEILKLVEENNKAKLELRHDLSQIIVTGILAIALYLAGVYVNSMIKLPAPIIMLVAVVIAKLIGIVPDNIEKGGFSLFKFIVPGITIPLLCGLGIYMTPWQDVVSVFSNPRYLIVILCTVIAIVATGWFVGNAVSMNPVESATVIACNAGQGGAGVISILTAGGRLELMPFGQLATRLGGGTTIIIATTLLAMLHG